jgi:hypothetical protein
MGFQPIPQQFLVAPASCWLFLGSDLASDFHMGQFGFSAAFSSIPLDSHFVPVVV